MEYILHNWKSFYSMICGACVLCINRICVFSLVHFPRSLYRRMIAASKLQVVTKSYFVSRVFVFVQAKCG